MPSATPDAGGPSALRARRGRYIGTAGVQQAVAGALLAANRRAPGPLAFGRKHASAVGQSHDRCRGIAITPIGVGARSLPVESDRAADPLGAAVITRKQPPGEAW